MAIIVAENGSIVNLDKIGHELKVI